MNPALGSALQAVAYNVGANPYLVCHVSSYTLYLCILVFIISQVTFPAL